MSEVPTVTERDELDEALQRVLDSSAPQPLKDICIAYVDTEKTLNIALQLLEEVEEHLAEKEIPMPNAAWAKAYMTLTGLHLVCVDEVGWISGKDKHLYSAEEILDEVNIPEVASD